MEKLVWIQKNEYFIEFFGFQKRHKLNVKVVFLSQRQKNRIKHNLFKSAKHQRFLSIRPSNEMFVNHALDKA